MLRIDGLTHKDWLMNGYPIKAERQMEQWASLQWDRAYIDVGPSPAGNLGPYWHVPVTVDGEELVYRMYPKLLLSKWGPLIYQACVEHAERAIKQRRRYRKAA